MKRLFIILAVVLFGCGVEHNALKPDGPLHVIITLKQENDALNNVMTAFNGIQTPDKMKIYYAQSIPNSATVDCVWNRMPNKDIDRIKKYCEKLPERLTVEYE